MPLVFERLTAAQIHALPGDKTVFFFPVGPLEDHGPHLPVGLDLAEAERMSWIAAEKLEREMPGWAGVIMPRAPLGVDTNTREISIRVRGYVLRDWLVDACHSLARAGFTNFVCFSGNLGPKQLTAIEEANKFLRVRTGSTWLKRMAKGKKRIPTIVSASSALVTKKDVGASPLWPDPKEHGGRTDTSIALHAMADSVQPTYSSLPPHEPTSTHWERMLKYWKGETRGYWGNPSDAHADQGRALLEERVNLVFTKLRAVWEGANSEALFRSWYSVMPPNRTFFKAWALSMAVLCLLLVWVYISFKMMID